MNSVQRKRRSLLRKKRQEDLQKKSNKAIKMEELQLRKIRPRLKIAKRIPNKLLNLNNQPLRMMMMSLKKKELITLTSILMIQLRSFKNSISEEKINLITKSLLEIHHWKRNLISKQRSKSKSDKREKKKCFGKEWLRFFQTRDFLFGVLLIKLWLSTMPFLWTDKTWLKKQVC